MIIPLIHFPFPEGFQVQGSALLKCFSTQQFTFLSCIPNKLQDIYSTQSYRIQVWKCTWNVHNICMNPKILSFFGDPHTRTPWHKQKDPEKRLSPRNWEQDTNMKLTISQHGLVYSAPCGRKVQLEGSSSSTDTAKMELCHRKSEVKTALIWSMTERLQDPHVHVFSKNKRRLSALSHLNFSQEQDYLRIAVLNSTKFSQHLWYFWDGKQHNPFNMRKLKEAKPFWCNYLS